MSATEQDSEHIEDNVCPVCHNSFEIFAVGACNHFVCYVCCVRMKFLCEQIDCPICRKDLKQVAITSQKIKFDLLNIHSFLFEPKEGVFSENLEVQKKYKKLLQHKCDKCKDTREFESFKLLKNHMSNTHMLYSCELCTKHLKLFSWERKFYTRQDLIEHKKNGDANDRSYKGHPLCEFCNERYFDNDSLLSHLRKDHFFCHFCESDGVTGEFYCEYKNLQDHFRDSHYLCEIDQCANVQWSNAFKSDLDLKAHIALEHSKGLTKNQAKQLRNFDLGFNYPSYPAQSVTFHGRGSRRGGRGGVANNDRGYHGGRGGRGGRNYNNDRNAIETAQILSSSLAQGQVGVIDRDLVRALQANSQSSSHNTASENSQKQQDVLLWANKNAEPKAAEAFQMEFPSLNNKPQPTVEQKTANKPKKDKGKVTPENTTMAAWLAHSVGRNVRDGEYFNQDFPTLPTANPASKTSKVNAKQTAWNKADQSATTSTQVQKLQTNNITTSNEFPGLHVYKKEKHSAIKPNASYGKFEVLKKQPQRPEVHSSTSDSNHRLMSSKSAKSLAEMSDMSLEDNFENGEVKKAETERNDKESTDINFRGESLFVKPGKWKKKGDEEDDIFDKKLKSKSKKGKNKSKNTKNSQEAEEKIKNEEIKKNKENEKRLEEREKELLKEKREIENKKKKLEEEREELQLKLLKESAENAAIENNRVTEDIRVHPTTASNVPPGFQAKSNPPPGFSKISTDNNIDFPPLSFPPGFKRN